jgi:GNAT superfamily N-acetyltransferase
MILTSVESARKEALSEIAASPVYAFNGAYNSPDMIDFCLPYGCKYAGLILNHPQYGRPFLMERGRLYVPSGLRGAGIGSRLVSALSYFALDRGIERTAGPVESPYAVRIHHDLFGEDNLRFAHEDPLTGQVIELPITATQAILSLGRAAEYERDLDYREIGFDIMYDDLGGVATASLEPPKWMREPVAV